MDPRTEPATGAPLAFGRGGPATTLGVSYQVLIGTAELLCRLGLGTAAATAQVTLEPRVISAPGRSQVGFDLLVRDGVDVYYEVKLKASAADGREWVDRVQECLGHVSADARFQLVHAEGSATTQSLRSISAIAAEAANEAAFADRIPPDGAIRQWFNRAGGDAFAVFRRTSVVARPVDAEERVLAVTARHLCVDAADASMLVAAISRRVVEASPGRLTLSPVDLARAVISDGIALADRAALPREMQRDILAGSDEVCCMCQRPGVEATVRKINGLALDLDPSNLAVLCGSCWDASRSRMALAPSVEVEFLRERRLKWEWSVAEARRRPVSSTAADPQSLSGLIAAHLVQDFHWDGPRRGEFASLGGRMEDRFYQANRGEQLSARPAYYHTYWGLVGLQAVAPHEFERHAVESADAVAARLAETGWIGVDLGDYSAVPSARVRRVQTIRHTARAAMILRLTGLHSQLASDIAWNILDEADVSTSEAGGWREFRREPDQPATLYATMYVIQLLASIATEDGWREALPALDAYRERAAPIIDRAWDFMAMAWRRDRWRMNDLPWQVNAAALMADVGQHTPPALRGEVIEAFEALVASSGRLVDPDAGAEFDAPEAVLGLRLAFATARLQDRWSPEGRVKLLSERLQSTAWDTAPIRTMDAAFLALMYAGHQAGRD